MYMNCNFVRTRHGTSVRGGDYGWEIYDNCIFCVGTMCTSSQYLMEYCDSGMDFIAMEFDNMDICRDAPWHVRTGGDFG